MKETKMFEAVIITGTGVEILRVSNSKKLLNEFVRDYIHRYVKDLYGWDEVHVIAGENSYTIMRNNNDFRAAFSIKEIECIDEIEDEEE